MRHYLTMIEMTLEPFEQSSADTVPDSRRQWLLTMTATASPGHHQMFHSERIQEGRATVLQPGLFPIAELYRAAFFSAELHTRSYYWDLDADNFGHHLSQPHDDGQLGVNLDLFGQQIYG
jgi:hypothetical protein